MGLRGRRAGSGRRKHNDATSYEWTLDSRCGIGDTIKDILTDYADDVGEQLEVGLDMAADAMVDYLEEVAPDDPNTAKDKYKDSFVVKRNYKRARYIGNSKTIKGAKSDKIPLINVLEFGDTDKGGRPHVRAAFDKMVDTLAKIITDNIGG